MLVGRKHLAPHVPWMIGCALLCGAAIAWYAVESRNATRWPGGSSRVGLTLGVAAAAIIVFELLLWPRKKVRAWRIGRAQTWMRAHIWFGLLCVPLAVLHSGFQMGGQLSSLLAWVFGIVIVSGILGLILQNIIPRVMLEHLPAETIYSQIAHVAAQCSRDAQRKIDMLCGGQPATLAGRREELDAGPVVIGAVRNKGSFRGRVLSTAVAPTTIRNGEALRTAFETTVAPYLEHGAKSGSQLRSREFARRWFERLSNSVDSAAHDTIDELAQLCEQRRQFDVQAKLHLVLHGWLLVHLPLSIALVALLAVHIVVAFKYW